MRQLWTLLIAALLTEGARGFAWDGGTPPPHRRSLALHARSGPERPVQRALLQDCRNSSGQAAQPCTNPAPRDSTYGSSPDGLTQASFVCSLPAAKSTNLTLVEVTVLPPNWMLPPDLHASQICGDRSACSVLLVAVGVILLLIVFACGLGGLCSRSAPLPACTVFAVRLAPGMRHAMPPPSAAASRAPGMKVYVV